MNYLNNVPCFCRRGGIGVRWVVGLHAVAHLGGNQVTNVMAEHVKGDSPTNLRQEK